MMIDEKMLEGLRVRIQPYLKEKRYRHTLAVESECAALAAIYAPEKESVLRVSGLLHDITKKCTVEEQCALCETYKIPYTALDLAMPKVFHAKTAAAVARDVFSDVTDEETADAIFRHTTGGSAMSLTASLLYLADYIEPTRTFPDCVALRSMFYDGISACGTETEREALLLDVLIRSFDMTIRGLLEEGKPIDPDTIAARNELLMRRASGVFFPKENR